MRLPSRLLPIPTVLLLAMGWLAAAPAHALPLGQEASPCEISPSTRTSPNVLLLGETTTVELSLTASCAGEAQPMHLVFVLDGSASMAGNRSDQLKAAVKSVIRGLDLPANPTTLVGIVEYNVVARTLCLLTNDEGRLIGCASRVGANRGTAMDRGIVEGLKVLNQARVALGGGVTPREVMLVVGDGDNNTGCEPVKSAARRAKGQRVIVMTVSMGGDIDAACMRQAANSEQHALHVDDPALLMAAFDTLLTTRLPVLSSLKLVGVIPTNMVLLEHTVRPAAMVSADGKSVTWEFGNIPQAGVSASFELRPSEHGYHPVTISVIADFTDSLGRIGSAPFPAHYVSVFGGFPAANPLAIESARLEGAGAIQGDEHPTKAGSAP